MYIVDGWVDTYVNTVSRILANVTGPRKALIGPWAHDYPESGSPGPSLDWAFEEVRWWKHWLAGVSTGIMDEPMLRVYMPYATASQTYPADTPGRWIADSAWPPTGTTRQTWFLDDGRLSPKPGSQAVSVYVADKIVGLEKPEWLPFPPAGLPREQTPDDQHSLLFDTAPLESDLEILGHPVAKIRVSANRPVAKLALRLCEVTSDGKSWLVTYGLLNLTHRDGDENPTPLTPGQTYDVRIDLSLIAHRFKRGSRIRLACLGKLVAAGLAIAGSGHLDTHARGIEPGTTGSTVCARSGFSDSRHSYQPGGLRTAWRPAGRGRSGRKRLVRDSSRTRPRLPSRYPTLARRSRARLR